MENKVRKSTLSELLTALFKSNLVLTTFGLFPPNFHYRKLFEASPQIEYLALLLLV